MPQSAIVSATRSIICLAERSRCGVPRWPRKYLLATTWVASCDQAFGISRSFCSKTASPRSLVMIASRVSHSTVSYGWTSGAREAPLDRQARPVPLLARGALAVARARRLRPVPVTVAVVAVGRRGCLGAVGGLGRRGGSGHGAGVPLRCVVAEARAIQWPSGSVRRLACAPYSQAADCMTRARPRQAKTTTSGGTFGRSTTRCSEPIVANV